MEEGRWVKRLGLSIITIGEEKIGRERFSREFILSWYLVWRMKGRGKCASFRWGLFWDMIHLLQGSDLIGNECRFLIRLFIVVDSDAST